MKGLMQEASRMLSGEQNNLNENKQINESRFAQMSADDLIEVFDMIMAERRSQVIMDMYEDFAQVQQASEVSDLEADEAESQFLDAWQNTHKNALEDACSEALEAFEARLKHMTEDMYRSAPKVE